MRYNLKITTESMLLTGSGEGGVLIDSDVVFHRTGFPYIPAKRVKGALKESTEEVLEIMGIDAEEKKDIIQTLFGTPGESSFSGKLMFKNLYVEHWTKTVAFLEKYAGHPAFQAENIKANCTLEVQQTALDDAGVARRHSLRNYRVIRPAITFESYIDVNEALEKVEENYLKRAVLNLRFLGTRRNRGFGKVKCQLGALMQSEASISGTAEHESKPGAVVSRIHVRVSTHSPVVLAQQIGEQNTVFTQKYITGNQLRGLLVQKWAKLQPERSGTTKGNKWHEYDDFYDLFLSGAVQYGPLYFNGATPIPLHIHQFKMNPERSPVSVFIRPDGITKPIGNIGKILPQNIIDAQSFEPKTTFNFHNSRPNRTAGRNTAVDSEGGIFYYEALDEGQVFEGEITGDSKKISKLLELFGSQFTARMGRSKSAQYGDVLVEFKWSDQEPNSDLITMPAGKYVLVLNSPAILTNNYGFPVPNGASLLEALPEPLRAVATIEHAAASIINIEQFNSVWLAKSGKIPAYREGSSFLINLNAEVKLEGPLLQIGEWREQGFGKAKLEPFDGAKTYDLKTPSQAGDQQVQEGASDVEKQIPVDMLLMRNIFNAYTAEKEILNAKSKGIADAMKHTNQILNHQIGRLERLFEQSNGINDIKNWFDQAKDKPAYETLKKMKLVDDKDEIKIERHNLKNFNQLQAYWVTFFQTKRKMNKYGKGQSK